MKKLLVAVFSAFFLAATPVWAAPVITTVSLPGGATPTVGGVTGTIFGSGFGGASSAAVLTIGSTVATITSRTATQIQFELPEYTGGNRSPGALLTVDGAGADPFTINYDPPSIVSLAGDTSVAGGVFSIIGENFGTDIGSLTVTVGGQVAALTLADHSEIQAILPAYVGGSAAQPVTVVGDGIGSNSVDLVYTSTPVISSVSGAAGPETGGNTFTIFGTEFDPATGLIVTVGGNMATVIDQSLTEITVIAPPGSGENQQIVVASATFGTESADEFLYNYETQVAIPAPGAALMFGLAVAGIGFARRWRGPTPRNKTVI